MAPKRKEFRIGWPASEKHPWTIATIESRLFAVSRPPDVSLFFDLNLPYCAFKWLTLVCG